ncbi:extracellular solute-binding protein [Paenibacillus glycanilyticus]|uniref:Sugar ABC transporter permease n=1 Tax=Paenibacillus glycanilyticus TaxID=126569 RepID=A0ABQ6GLQ5_9BACL|nr:extracellular solute-binding protein [Paenibacillus glycanilyticus]GLX71165.1 sugar ABC transporter permease [Paenibacillus glycanilyticus]
MPSQKRKSVLALSLALTLSLGALSACSGNNNGGNANSEASSTTNSQTNNASKTEPSPPADAKPVDISMWAELNGNAAAVVSNLNEVAAVKEWGKRTNVNFTFNHPAAGSNDAFGVMLASGDLPDVIFQNWNWIPGGLPKMFTDGSVIKLNDLIDQYAPNLKKMLDDNPEVAKQLKADNGDIYAIPHLRAGEHGKYKTFSGLIIRQDWLDELHLQKPETIAEWENVLKTFKEKKGVTPYTLSKDQIVGYNDFLGAYGLNIDFYVDNGKVKYGSIEPAFKDYLSTFKKWYDEGLIDHDFATNDSKTKDAIITSGKAGAFFGYIGSSIGVYTPALQQTEPNAKLEAVQFPVLNKGDEPSFVPRSWEWDGFGAAISTSDKNPVETIKALDYLYSPEGQLLKNFGIEGETYNMVNGEPVYTDLILKNPDGLPIAQAMAKYFVANYSFIGPDDDRFNDQFYQLDSQKDAVKTFSQYADNAMKVLMPPVSLTPEESDEVAKIMNDVTTYRNEMTIKIALGAEPIDAFDKMVDQLKKMNIEKVIAIQQAALDRYNSR